MKALSVKQPYAEAIARGSKTREYRTWRVSHRGPLLICASKAPRIGTLPCGVAVCTVDLVDVTGSPGRYAWILANPRRVEPFAVRGFAALYSAPDALIVPMPGEPSYARASVAEGAEGEEGESRRVREGRAATRKLLALLGRS